MARIRTIKPDFFVHTGLGELSPCHRLLFAGLWTQADKAGRLKDDPKKLKILLLPYDDVEVDNLLNDLNNHRERFVVRYAVKGEKYIQINRFHLHQQPHIKEKDSTIPAPCKYRANTNKAPCQHHASTVQIPIKHHAKTPVLGTVLGKEGTPPTPLTDFLDLFPEKFRDSQEFKKIWLKWLEYRKQEKRNKITQSVAERQINKLSAVSVEDAIKIINQSLDHGWTGLFEVKQIQRKKGILDD